MFSFCVKNNMLIKNKSARSQMSMHKLSQRLLIQLYHDYFDVEAFNLSAVECTTGTQAVILALFLLNETNGSTLASIQSTVATYCPAISATEVETALTNGLKRGIFLQLHPVFIVYTEPQPAARYTFHHFMDKFGNTAAVRYLLGLVGSQCGSSFASFFKLYTDPEGNRKFLINC